MDTVGPTCGRYYPTVVIAVVISQYQHVGIYNLQHTLCHNIFLNHQQIR